MLDPAPAPRLPGRRACCAASIRARARARLALVLAVAALGGCVGARDDDLFGMNLDVRTAQPWGTDPALRRRVHDLIQASCDQMGLDPSMLYGMTLRIEDGGIACAGIANARGCTWREDGVMAVSTLAWTTAEPPVPCVEDTPIPHELLHVKIGDPEHRDSRWSDSVYWRTLSKNVVRTGCSEDPAYLLW